MSGFPSHDQPMSQEDVDELPASAESRPAGAPEPIIAAMDQIEERALSWLWSGVVPLGKLTLIAGDPGVGKSLVTLDLAARVSSGAPFPLSAAPTCPGGAILIGAEDGLADTVRPRLAAAGAHLGLVKALQAVRQRYWVRDPPWSDFSKHVPCREPFDLRNLTVLTRAIDSVPDCRLVVIDPLSAYLSPGGKGGGELARRVLTKLAEVAARRQVAIVAVTHFTKSARDPLMYRPLGGLSALAVARSAWVIVRERGSETRWMLPLKQNLRESTGGLAFLITAEANGQPRIEWVEPSAEKLPDGQPVPDNPAALTTDGVQSELAGLAGRPAPLPELDVHQQLTALLARHGGQITARALMRADRQYKNTNQAEAALAELVAAGLAKRRLLPIGERGGRPVEVFEAPEGKSASTED